MIFDILLFLLIGYLYYLDWLNYRRILKADKEIENLQANLDSVIEILNKVTK